MRPVPATEYASAAVLTAIRRERAEGRTRFQSRWWYPLTCLLVVVCCVWGSLKADQLIAEKLIWPTAGAQFVEAGPRPDDPSATGGPMTIVVAGLNRKNGSGVAASLMDSLSRGHTRVFSLVYGSGINDQDILDKFDALMTETQPSDISFFGSSMGGDVVLRLAAHAQAARDEYRESLLAGLDPTGSDPADTGRVGAPGGDTSRADLSGAAPLLDNGALGSATDNADSTGDTASGDTASSDTAPGDAVLRDTAESGRWRVAALEADPAASARPPDPAGDTAPPDRRPPPRLGTIYLDCSPLGADDVRDSSRTQADAITGLTEALNTDGGVAVRLTAEVLAQRDEWSSGEFPFLQVRWDEFRFKFGQVWREKIGAPGISTQLIKDQYGVIRRTDIDDIVTALGPGTRIVYFLPENRHDDRTIRVEQVEQTLRRLAPEHGLDLRIVPIPDGHHASAESNSEAYRSAIDAINRTGT